MQAQTSPALPSNVLPLLSVIAAIFLWLGADELQGRVRENEVQIGSALKRIGRASPQEMASRQSEAQRLDTIRENLLQRLRSPESEQMTRAKLVFELRQKCNAVSLACQIRLADLTSAETLKKTGITKDSEVSLEGLGVSRARAILTGSFKTTELLDLYTVFAEDPDAQWRVNAIVVKGSEFEFDVERLVLREQVGAKP